MGSPAIRRRRRYAVGAAATAYFGALTIATDAAVATTEADGTYGEFTVASGQLYGNTSPLTVGEHTVGSTTVTVEADVYSCGEGELGAIFALGSAALDGTTIKGRPGADIIGTTAGDLVTTGASMDYSTGLVITSEDPDDKCYLRRLSLGQNGQIWLDKVIVRDYRADDDTINTTSIIRFVTNGGAGPYATKLKLTCCEIYSNTLDPGEYDPTPVSAVTDGKEYKIATIVDADWSSIGGSATANVGDIFIATATSADISALGTAKKAPEILYGIGASTQGTNQHYELEATDNYFHNLNRSITGTFKALSSQRNLFADSYDDAHSLAVKGNETSWLIKDNAYINTLGRYEDPWNPHMDAAQVNLLPMTATNTVPYQVIGNRTWQKDGRGWIQTVFFENYNVTTPVPVYAVIKHNMGLVTADNGITLEKTSADSIIKWNTVAYDVNAPGASNYEPHIRCDDEDAAATVRHNASLGMEFNSSPLSEAKAQNNYTFTAATNAAMDDALAGTDFDGSSMTDLADFTARLSPKSGGPMDTPTIKIGAGAYYTYDNSAPPAGSMSGLGEGLASEPAAVAPEAFTSLMWSVASAGATSADVTIISMPDENEAAITDIDYRIDGGTWTSSGGITDFTISSGLTEDVEADIEIRAVNSAGDGDASDTKQVTPTSSYAENAVEFDGTNDYLYSGSGYTGTGSKKALIRFNLYVPTTWAADKQVMVGYNGGTAVVHVKTAPSGRLEIIFRNSGGSVIATGVVATSTFAADTQYLVLIGLDTTTGTERMQCYVNGSAVSWNSGPTITADGVIAAHTKFGVGALYNGTLKLPGYLAGVFVTTTETLDLSVSGNRDKLGSGIDMGSDGSTPTGTAPELFLNNAVAANWHTNLGSGGGLGLNGTLTDAPVQP